MKVVSYFLLGEKNEKYNDFKKQSFKKVRIIQGFLSTVPERTVRIRIVEDKGFITVKGIGNTEGVTRFEWEKEIALNDAKDLLSISEPGIISKTRYYVKYAEQLFEVDEFDEDNLGLIVAEIELKHEKSCVQKPKWLGEEVTGISKYYNSSLVNTPFLKWF